MKKIAFLRSVDIQRADPYIQQAVTELTAERIACGLFFTHGDAFDADFPGERIRIAPDITARDLADRVTAWGADAVVSISLPCENAVRDAAVKQVLDRAGIPTIMTPLAATLLLTDKWETKQLLLRHGLDVPVGFRADSDLLAGRGLPVPGYPDALRLQADSTGYPLLSKPIWDSTSMGIRALAGPADLDSYLADPPPVSAVIEQAVTGDLCSVDIVGAPGTYRVGPLVWTGRAGAKPVFTFADLRWCGPRPREDAEFRSVAERLTAVCTALEVTGSVNVDMIYTDGSYKILEFNPRIGGATTLTCAASRTNTFRTLARMALGAPAAVPDAAQGRRWAVEFLTPQGIPDAVRDEFAAALDLVTCHALVIDGHDHGHITVFTAEEGSEEDTVQTIKNLHETTGYPNPDTVDKIRALLTP
ncbi:ATP-grasp domain-containing protein [Streptomyces sp. NPDC048045]|uniref:ATP-grasp domain-containing protein n=1 Tax=Streptomyces sp. NPDC048045 TaxID=3154710 RepID=UPI0034420349